MNVLKQVSQRKVLLPLLSFCLEGGEGRGRSRGRGRGRGSGRSGRGRGKGMQIFKSTHSDGLCGESEEGK